MQDGGSSVKGDEGAVQRDEGAVQRDEGDRVESVDTGRAASIVENQDAVVLDVLGEESFRQQHLPGAINIPVDAPDFAERVRKAVPDQGTLVMVYCADEACKASPRAYRRLKQMGYRNVVEFKAGLAGWHRARKPFEGEGPRRIRADV